VRYVFRDMPLASLHPTSPQGHAAARCAAEQGAGIFWTMHDTLFSQQEQWRSLPDPTSYLAGVAQNSGAEMTPYSQCINTGRAQTAIQQSIAAGSALGFNGTPSFQFIEKKSGKTYQMIGAYPAETFSQWIEPILAGQEPAQAKATATPAPVELPLWANAKGLAADSKRPGFNLAGDPYRGDLEASVVVVEFSNFQCTACKKHALEVQPAIDQALVNTGQVLWVFKNLMLRSLPQSPAAAAAAECAGEQGRFWEMHDLLFSTQEQWSVNPPDPVLTALAGQLKLDAARFSACLSSRQALERVLADMYDAQGTASTTPTFVVLYKGKGTLIQGSRSAEEFINTLKGFLEPANGKK
jgi:protein-disulfide isomerase